MKRILVLICFLSLLAGCNGNNVASINDMQTNSANTKGSIINKETLKSIQSETQLTLNPASNSTNITNSGLLISCYQDYLVSLSPEIESVGYAYDKFCEVKTTDTEINDRLFKAFYNFYSNVLNNVHDSISEGRTYNDSELKQNGFQKLVCEEGEFVFEDVNYLSKCFLPCVSESTADFIRLDNEDKKIREGGFLITDSYLVITRDELCDIMIKWEDYTNKYPRNDWKCQIAEETINFYIACYTDIELVTFSDMRGETETEKDLLHTYKRFIEKYSSSRYFSLINEYYQVIRRDGVKKTDITSNILKKHGIED